MSYFIFHNVYIFDNSNVFLLFIESNDGIYTLECDKSKLLLNTFLNCFCEVYVNLNRGFDLILHHCDQCGCFTLLLDEKEPRSGKI